MASFRVRDQKSYQSLTSVYSYKSESKIHLHPHPTMTLSLVFPHRMPRDQSHDEQDQRKRTNREDRIAENP